jgi:predicted metal-dependent phosphotriesterase family hydrolase
LIDEAKDVVKICKVWDAMLGVSHLYDDEVEALVRFAKKEKFDKVVITHANWTIIRGHKSAQLKEFIGMGAWVEFCGTAMLPPYNCLTIDEEVRWLKELGTQRCVLASDAGAQIYGTVPSMLRAYLQILNNAGIPVEALKTMAIDNPKRLLHMS